MAELEIDQTNLPRVQEVTDRTHKGKLEILLVDSLLSSTTVCQCFAVLEDGALAHNLQEQEIEQYYTTNIQKNQLVQNDIRVAKRLQDEEEEQWAQQSALLRQTSRQLEEQDFEYARLIQEEILRHAEEEERREQDDEEMAKRIQEEEKERLRRSSSRGQEGHSEGSVSDPALSIPPQHTLSSLHQGEEHYSSTTARWQCSSSNNHSNLNEPKAESRSGVLAQKNTTSWSNQGHTDSFREIRREPLSDDSEDSDTVFSEWLPDVSQRVNERHAISHPQRHSSFHHPLDRNYRSPCPCCTLTDELRVWEEERGELDEGCSKNGDLERRSHRSWAQERNHREEYEGLCRSRDLNRDSRSGEERERRCSHSESFRLPERIRKSSRNLARTWSYRDYSDKHVRFLDDSRSFSRQRGESSGVWEMLGQVLRERGVPVRIGSNGVPLQIRPESRGSQVLHGSVVSCSDSQPHQRLLQRASTARHSFHGDMREKKHLSYQANSGRDHSEGRDRHCNIEERDGEVFEIRRRDSYLGNGERGGSRRWREHRCASDGVSDRTVNDCGVKRATSERRHWHNTIEERLSSEEDQEVERRGEQHRRRAPQRSQSLRSSRASTRDRSRRVAAGASLQPELSKERLDLGELQQVLQDEELARNLQEEEEKQLRRNSHPTCISYPEGDFRVAQVAQDEEIAHFMQKQEIKSKRRSREFDGPSSWREHRAMISHHGRQHRQVHRERLDSEGLPSPTDDCSPDNQPPSPASTLLQTQHIRNIAEELDPTFQARRQGTESLRVGQAGSTSQPLPTPHSGLHDFLEEPTFIPPTKRQTDKSGRCKPKEKKENCKQQ